MKKLLYSASLALALSSQVEATLPAAAVWECRATATAGNVNGGFFNSARGGTDYTLQNAAQLHNTDGTAAGTTTFTSVTGGFTSAMVGNGLHIVSGAGFTTGWYEVVTFTDANTVVLDASPGTGTVASFYVGGALSWGSTLDDEACEAFVGGNIVYIKNGSFSLGEVVSVASASATATLNVQLLGYNSTRGDAPTGTSRPLIAMGVNNLTTGANWTVKNLRITEGTTGTLTAVLSGTDNTFENVYILNSSTTTTRFALSAGNFQWCLNCEFIDPSGTALTAGAQTWYIGCYFHDSDTCVTAAGGTATFVHCLFEGGKTAAFVGSTTTAHNTLINCTFYGSEAKIGTGISTTAATSIGLRVVDSIFYGLANGITIGTVQQDSVYENYNSFNNVTTARTLIATGANSVTTNPSFTGAAQITGSTATTSGSVLTQSGGDFSTVTDSVDFVRVTSGTGVTAGIYIITSHTSTTLTVTGTLGTSSAGNVVYTVGTGHNFLPTGGL